MMKCVFLYFGGFWIICNWLKCLLCVKNWCNVCCCDVFSGKTYSFSRSSYEDLLLFSILFFLLICLLLFLLELLNFMCVVCLVLMIWCVNVMCGCMKYACVMRWYETSDVSATVLNLMFLMLLKMCECFVNSGMMFVFCVLLCFCMSVSVECVLLSARRNSIIVVGRR